MFDANMFDCVKDWKDRNTGDENWISMCAMAIEFSVLDKEYKNLHQWDLVS